MISIVRIDDSTFDVTVESDSVTQHRVSVPKQYYKKLTQGRISYEDLVRRSFEFLLVREPNTSILRTFDLTVINRYFPEYEQTIQSV